MKKNTNITAIVLGTLGILLIGYFVWLNYTAPKRYYWYESYNPKLKDDAHGILYLKRLLESYHPEGTFSVNEKVPLSSLLIDVNDNTDYILVGNECFLDSADQEALFSFVERGNDAFIAVNDLPEWLKKQIYRDSCKQPLHDTTRTLSTVFNFVHDSLHSGKGYTFSYRYGAMDVKHAWAYNIFNSKCELDSAATFIGYQTAGPNFLKISRGTGAIYVHANPIVFTNYYLAQADKFEYASGVFGHLQGKDIILDEYSKLPFSYNRQDPYSSPLHYILQQPSLKYAWWVLLVTGLLYILFASKRTQKPIPVLEQKTNTSLEFVQLISTLHLLHGNPTDMAKKKMKYFLYVVRAKYGIQATSFSEEQMTLLAVKSKVSLPEIKTIFDQFGNLTENIYANQTDKLINLFNAIENFKTKCQ